MRLAAPLGALLVLLIGPLMLAEAGGWAGQRSFAEELGSTLGISALGVLAIVLILPTRLRAGAPRRRCGRATAPPPRRRAPCFDRRPRRLGGRAAARAVPALALLRPTVARAGGDHLRRLPPRPDRRVHLAPATSPS